MTDKALDRDVLDKKYRALERQALRDAPVDALSGISPSGAKHLKAVLGVRTIEDLASNRYVSAAQRLVGVTMPPRTGPESSLNQDATLKQVEDLRLVVKQLHSQTERDLTRLQASMAALHAEIASISQRLPPQG